MTFNKFRLSILILTLACCFLRVDGANGQTKKKKATPPPKARLETTLKLSDQIINGKFQTPGEGTVVVEDEKGVFNLLSIRMNFNDRRKKELQRDGGQSGH